MPAHGRTIATRPGIEVPGTCVWSPTCTCVSYIRSASMATG